MTKTLNVKLGVLMTCLLLLFIFSTTTVLAEKLPPELDNDAFKNACLQCHVFDGKFFGDFPKKKRGRIYGKKVGEDPKLGFTTKKNRTDLADPKRQKVAIIMSEEVLIAVVNSNMMVPMTEKEEKSVIVAAKIYRDYAEKNLKNKNES